MKFFGFKEFRQIIKPTLESIAYYLTVDLTTSMRELANGLTKLNFRDNFESFEVEVSIAAGAELEIRNELVGVIPSERLIVRGNDGSQNIVDGDTEWTLNFVYLKNVGATTAEAKIIFFK